MTSPTLPTPEHRYVINPLFLFRWEASQNAHVLLYPEGVVKLNASAASILKLCNGTYNVTQMVDHLSERYDGSPRELIGQSLIKFLEAADAKGWINAVA
ncbi:pyrroloquinoline quinone biosynthesis peptide chaperone PqqD [Marinobacterium sp. D7]|uniref:pyrroloquinoline quinone biosynthesis peptide chaperone PqqD n=1 Tax=Marinobacterium ramblicola TaxID=2849041 RepID=UPI001C2DBBEC|nr:pyrroloquinoline quinone biosynthesis peptide chaperone PqqD [Marinobacterium ramblicola]MBV1787527.1 pyrroloquinoline quinone biosynthesis peptide chaperone PqqD [Marinobacterium ramblicola]